MYQVRDQNRSEGRSPERASQSTDRGPEAADDRVRSSTLFAPVAVSAAYAAGELFAGPAVFDTGAAGSARAASLGLLGLLLLLAGYVTSRLYAEARRRTDREAAWRPNPWLYVWGGALALLALRAAETVTVGRPVPSPAVYALGNAVAALPLASIVAGPVYWANRRRHRRSS